MSRVSQLELYNDKDVITQILLMKEQVVTGTYKNVDVQDDGSGNLVFTFTDQNDDPTTFNIPVKLISTVTSSQSGSTVSMRITWTDGTHTDLSWTAGGDVTTNTAQTISAVKTFTASPVVPTTPGSATSAVNQSYVESTVPGVNDLLHKSGNETAAGNKTFTGDVFIPRLEGHPIVNPNSVWHAVYKVTRNDRNPSLNFIISDRTGCGMAFLAFNVSTQVFTAKDVVKAGSPAVSVGLTEIDGFYYLCVKVTSNSYVQVRMLSCMQGAYHTNIEAVDIELDAAATIYDANIWS